MKKVNELKSMIKQDKEKEKKSNSRHTDFKKSLDGLDKILDLEPMNTRALVNKENKETSINENPSLTYFSKNKKKALADLKSASNKAYEWYLRHVKEEKTMVELNVNPIEGKYSNTKDLEGLKDNYRENTGMKSAKAILGDGDRIVDKNKAFNYHQKVADMRNINGMYSIGYCYQNGFGVEKNKHNTFKYYKKSTDAGNANRTFMVGNCYHNDKDSNGPYCQEFYA